MKKCNKCEKIKNTSEFYSDKRNKDKLQGICKDCFNKRQTNLCRTKIGLINRIYSHQRENCRKRNHKYPEYSLKELREWCLSKKEYHLQFEIWKINNYDFKFAPSIDRLNDYKSYSFSNIRIISAIENIRIANLNAKNGVTNKMNKSVCRYNLDGNLIQEYYSLKSAERKTGIRNGNISNCCSGRYKTAGGFIWKYKET